MVSEAYAIDRAFMKMALKEARKAEGRTSPNPLVGAVVVKDGKLIARGYHKKAGTPHAEIHALRQAGRKAKGATIYVTLEPCNHHGRTPPCTEAILKSGVRRVVIGQLDPNRVAAGGSSFLTTAGLEVCSGVLAEECRAINRPFVKYVTTGMPWVIMKAGLSLDGKIAAADGRCAWITNEKSRRFVHRLRDRVDAILIGVGTALNDDPSLTTRLPNRVGHDPLRIVLDTNLRTGPDAKMMAMDSKAKTIIFCGNEADPAQIKLLTQAGAEVVLVDLGDDGHPELKMVLKELGRRQITTLLVEGGGKVHASFLGHGLVDQVNLFYGPIFIGSEGISVVGSLGLERIEQARRLHVVKRRRFGDDLMIEGIFRSS